MVVPLVVLVVLVRLLGRILVSFLILILRMFGVFFMERSVDVVFRDSILWNLPPISAGVEVCKIDIRRDRWREKLPIWAPVRPVANQGITFAVSCNDISAADAILVHEKRISKKTFVRLGLFNCSSIWDVPCFKQSLFNETWKIGSLLNWLVFFVVEIFCWVHFYSYSWNIDVQKMCLFLTAVNAKLNAWVASTEHVGTYVHTGCFECVQFG